MFHGNLESRETIQITLRGNFEGVPYNGLSFSGYASSISRLHV
jgi:hypothetical protein